MAKQRILTGEKELDNALNELSVTTANKVAKASVRAGIRQITKAVKANAKGSIKDAVGEKFKAFRKGSRIDAKAGINVGKAGKREDPKGKKPVAVAYVVGTPKRFRKRLGGKFAYIKKPTSRQLRTNQMPANPIVQEGASEARPAVKTAILTAAKKALEKEAARIRKKTLKGK